MREILFKAKRVDNGEWIEGYGVCLVPNEDLATIIGFSLGNLMQSTQVVPETVCQFTGLKDKNGVKIFEGDKISSEQWNPKEYIVIFIDGQFCFQNGVEKPYYQDIHYAKDFEITGNIHNKN